MLRPLLGIASRPFASNAGGVEQKGKDSILGNSVFSIFVFSESFFICVGFSGDVKAVDGFPAVGFSDDGSAADGPFGGSSCGVGRSRMMYSLELNFPSRSVVWRRWTYPARSSSTTAARMASFPSRLMRARPERV